MGCLLPIPFPIVYSAWGLFAYCSLWCPVRGLCSGLLQGNRQRLKGSIRRRVCVFVSASVVWVAGLARFACKGCVQAHCRVSVVCISVRVRLVGHWFLSLHARFSCDRAAIYNVSASSLAHWWVAQCGASAWADGGDKWKRTTEEARDHPSLRCSKARPVHGQRYASRGRRENAHAQTRLACWAPSQVHGWQQWYLVKSHAFATRTSKGVSCF